MFSNVFVCCVVDVVVVVVRACVCVCVIYEHHWQYFDSRLLQVNKDSFKVFPDCNHAEKIFISFPGISLNTFGKRVISKCFSVTKTCVGI